MYGSENTPKTEMNDMSSDSSCSEVQKRDTRNIKGLPPGWRREVVTRKTGQSAGKFDVYYYRHDCLQDETIIKVHELLGNMNGCFERLALPWIPDHLSPCTVASPDGKKFRSKPQIIRYLGNSVDLALFDFSSRDGTSGEATKRRTARERSVKTKVYTPRYGPSEERPFTNHPLRSSGPIRRTCGVIKLPVVWIPPKKDEHPTPPNGSGDQDTPLGAIVQRLWERRLVLPVVTFNNFSTKEHQVLASDETGKQVVQLINGSLMTVDPILATSPDPSTDLEEEMNAKNPSPL